MPILDRAFTGVERNDPCPCGSGRKFKQCHGRPQPAPSSKPLPAPQSRSGATT
jgi:preprotein translocase subunit SecA